MKSLRAPQAVKHGKYGGLFDHDGDRGAVNGGLMGNVRPIAHQQLQGVFARRQVQFGFALPLTKMQMVGIIGNRFIQRRQGGIDQQMVVSRSWLILTRGRKLHVF